MNASQILSRFAQISVFGAQATPELWAAAWAALLDGKEGIMVQSYEDDTVVLRAKCEMDREGPTGCSFCVDGHAVVIEDGVIRTSYGANVHSAYVSVSKEAIFLETDELASETHWPYYERVGLGRAAGNLSAVRSAGILMKGGFSAEEFDILGTGVAIRLTHEDGSCGRCAACGCAGRVDDNLPDGVSPCLDCDRA